MMSCDLYICSPAVLSALNLYKEPAMTLLTTLIKQASISLNCADPLSWIIIIFSSLSFDKPNTGHTISLFLTKPLARLCLPKFGMNFKKVAS